MSKEYACYGLFVNDELYEVYKTDSRLNDAMYGIADSRQCAGETIKMEIIGYLQEEDPYGDAISINEFMPADFFEKFKGTVEWTVERNIMINKVGGNAGKDSVNYRVSLPVNMVKAIGISQNNRSVVLELTADGILIKKKAAE